MASSGPTSGSRAAKAPSSLPLRQARLAWNLLHVDSPRAHMLAERALATAVQCGNATAEGWARLARGFHGLYYATAEEAETECRRALACFGAVGDRGGQILAATLIARATWRQGHFEQALALVMPLRDEGVRVLRREQRGVLLNTIAGCHSALGRSDLAFAYMYEALRDAGPRLGRGFDTVLHCNLSHELLQVGDCEAALRQIDLGLSRGVGLKNPRLTSVLRINRVMALTDLGRAADALPDVHALLALPPDASGRGPMEAAFETMAIAAFRAGDGELGAELMARVKGQPAPSLPDEQLECVNADALMALSQGNPKSALGLLQAHHEQAMSDDVAGLSLRTRVQYFGLMSECFEASGDIQGALVALKRCQQLQGVRAELASRARYQAAALQTELLRLKHRLEEKDAQRRETERARAELAAANEQLSHTIVEVQALQDALRQQATQDPLTGLFNRRHLNDTLPTLFALSRRESQPLALVIIDLDHFKAVNDGHGHVAGDRLLAAFGEMLLAESRRSDVACRYGGEEFCLLMPRTDVPTARRKTEALLRRWQGMRFEIDGRVLQNLSFSAGVADTRLARGSPDILLKAADDLLLAAKREGRSRIGVPVGAEDAASEPRSGR